MGAAVGKNLAFDRLTELAAALFDAPIALITVVGEDRQWFRSNNGYGADQTARDESFCAHMLGNPPGATLVVTDSTADPRFRDNRLVTQEGVRFYAGAVITTADGAQDGAVCVLDTVPRAAPTKAQLESLKLLAQLAGHEIDAARLLRRQAEHTAMLEMAEDLAGVGHWRLEVTNNRLDWSDEIYRIHGRDPAFYVPTAEDSLLHYHPEDRALLASNMQRALETGEGYQLHLRLINPTKGERRVTTRACVETDENGNTIALFGVLQDMTERLATEVRLQASESSFRLLSETSTDIVARFDDQGRFLYVSPSVRNILGRDPDEMLGKDCSAFIAPDEIKRIRKILKAYVAEGPLASPPRYEYRAARADGTWVWLEATPRAIRDTQGQVIEFHDCVRDITASKNAERAQQELVDTLNMAESLAGLGSWRLDVATGSVRWSEQVYRIHGVTSETFDPNLDNAIGFYHREDQQAVRDWCRTAIETGKADELELRIVRPDGEERFVVSQCKPERGPTGATTALFGVFQDVTDRVRSEQRIAASEARYRLLADNVKDVIAVYEISGEFKYLSPSIIGPMGYTPDELVGLLFDRFVHPDDVARVKTAFADYARSPEGTASPKIPYRAVRKDGSLVWLEAHPTVIRDTDGRPIEFHDVVRDITKAKDLEAALIDARNASDAATAVKADFLSNMSHELRTPLTSIIGFTGLVSNQPELSALSRKYIERITNAGRALMCTVNDILDFSKLEAGQVSIHPEPTSIRDLIQSTLELFEPQAGAKDLGLSIDGDLDNADLVLLIDPDRVRQILLNLVSNAVKFTHQGTVCVRTGFRRSEGMLRVDVTDTGDGLSAEQQGRLFQRFSQIDGSLTRTQSGTGLGLAICKGLAEAMGGRIGVNSEVGKGSNFWFEISAQPSTLPGVRSESSSPDAIMCSGQRVLVVDDNSTNRELVRLFLSGIGAEISEAVDGEEAVRMASELPYDLILMDLQMPVLGGHGALTRIRSRPGPNDATPIIAFTAQGDASSRASLLSLGFEDVVSKPIDSGALIEAVSRAATFVDQSSAALNAA